MHTTIALRGTSASNTVKLLLKKGYPQLLQRFHRLFQLTPDLNTKLTSVDGGSDRPTTTIVLAMSADGKIADFSRSAARFGSANDQAHLERQVAQADGVLFGAGTLRAYGSTLRVTQPDLLQQRQQQGRPLQPIQLVCSRSAAIDPSITFFRQPVTRWLLTTPTGARLWQEGAAFERILMTPTETMDWQAALQNLWVLGLRHLVVLGGGTLVAALLQANLIDECWLTVCPLLLGGVAAPTPVEGNGFTEALAPQLQLLEARSLGDEVFLHYKVRKV